MMERNSQKKKGKGKQDGVRKPMPQRGNSRTHKMSKREIMSQKYKKFKGSTETGQGFADKRKQQMLSSYRKTLAKEKANLEGFSSKLKKLYAEEGESASKETDSKKLSIKKKGKVSKFHKAEAEFKRREEEKEKKDKEHLEHQKQKNSALDAYKSKKKSQHKQLSKKNYKGQPNMASQMELLLNKIQSGSS